MTGQRVNQLEDEKDGKEWHEFVGRFRAKERGRMQCWRL